MESLKHSIDPKFGVGLRTEHYPLLYDRPKTSIDYFEAITENHMDSMGPPLRILEQVRKDYDLSFHGVSLNLASYEDFNLRYLKNAKELYQRFEPFLISDHLCWTGLSDSNLHNLLPFSYDEEHLNHIVNKIDKVQNFFGRTMAFENLSAYFDYNSSTYHEWEFIAELLKRSDCEILLDVNNVYVNSINHCFDAKKYIDTIPSNKIAEIHLAGFSIIDNLLFDTHSNPVFPEVWELYKYTVATKIPKYTLVEWDEDIPEFYVLEQEVSKAKNIWGYND
jgi:uncharacterized protein (UPF0276 family)